MDKLKSYGDAVEETDYTAIWKAEKRLLPCPFCGGKAAIDYIPPHTHGIFDEIPDYHGGHFIECLDCTAAISGGPNLDAAIAAWNRRTA